MGKFDAILLCSDMDDTLLTTDKRISAENKAAIEYFMSEGGSFAFATGRVPMGARLALDYIVPNTPIICFNGAGIYDFRGEKLLWSRSLDKKAVAVVEMVEKSMPQAAIEVCTKDKVYCCRSNEIIRKQFEIEKFDDNYADFRNISEDWIKAIFMVKSDELPALKALIAESEFADCYNYIQSSPNYYEMLPKGASKGDAMLELAKILGIAPERTIGVGDNENDITMVSMAQIGVAVANAVPAVRDAADYITVDNNHDALKAVIESVEKGIMQF